MNYRDLIKKQRYVPRLSYDNQKIKMSYWVPELKCRAYAYFDLLGNVKTNRYIEDILYVYSITPTVIKRIPSMRAKFFVPKVKSHTKTFKMGDVEVANVNMQWAIKMRRFDVYLEAWRMLHPGKRGNQKLLLEEFKKLV